MFELSAPQPHKLQKIMYTANIYNKILSAKTNLNVNTEIFVLQTGFDHRLSMVDH